MKLYKRRFLIFNFNIYMQFNIECKIGLMTLFITMDFKYIFGTSLLMKFINVLRYDSYPSTLLGQARFTFRNSFVGLANNKKKNNSI